MPACIRFKFRSHHTFSTLAKCHLWLWFPFPCWTKESLSDNGLSSVLFGPFSLFLGNVATELSGQLVHASLVEKRKALRSSLLTQVLQGCLAKLGHFRSHSNNVALVRIILELFDCEGLCLWIGGKPREKECKRWQPEELVLGLLAVLVHWFADGGEIDDRVLQKIVVFVMPVRQN